MDDEDFVGQGKVPGVNQHFHDTQKRSSIYRALSFCLEFELVAEKTACAGVKDFRGYFRSVEECKNSCGRRMPMFIFGRHGGRACYRRTAWAGRCACQCEKESTWKTGQCYEIRPAFKIWSYDITDFDLFRYTSK